MSTLSSLFKLVNLYHERYFTHSHNGERLNLRRKRSIGLPERDYWRSGDSETQFRRGLQGYQSPSLHLVRAEI